MNRPTDPIDAALPPTDPGAAAVLVSGGLDSAVLLAETLRGAAAVHPLYVRGGFVWEGSEIASLRRYLEALAGPSLRPLRVLDMPVADLIPGHWGLTGQGVPGSSSPDEAVYLPGRNALLLAKAVVWCRLNGVGSVALATLKGNPFPDATPEFFAAYQHALDLALRGTVRVLRPYEGLTKEDVLRRGRGLPLERTLSCVNPVDGDHCGACNKCEERRRAFESAGVLDRTRYAKRG